MIKRSKFIPMDCYGYHYHKGFYNDEKFEGTLWELKYKDFGEVPENDDMFPYYSANQLLFGGCNFFALALKKVFDYNVYVIEEKKKRGFYAFCQVYKNEKWYYIDARGITTSFDEFMNIAGKFVNDEFTIRLADSSDIENWTKDNYYEKSCAFAEAVIEKYKECYEL